MLVHFLILNPKDEAYFSKPNLTLSSESNSESICVRRFNYLIGFNPKSF